METFNYSYKLQVQVSYRFEIDLGPRPELHNNIFKRGTVKFCFLDRVGCNSAPYGPNDLKFCMRGSFGMATVKANHIWRLEQVLMASVEVT